MSDIKRDLNDLNFWNTDQSVDPPVMTRGMVGKDASGTWRYLTASASGYLMVSGSFGGSVTTAPLSADGSSISAKQGDANNLHVSSFSQDAALMRVSAIGVTVNTSPLSADSSSISAKQGDATNLNVSAKSNDAGLFLVSAAQKGTWTLDTGSVSAKSSDAAFFRVSAVGTLTVSAHEVKQSDAASLRVSAIVDSGSVSAKSSDAGTFLVSAAQKGTWTLDTGSVSAKSSDAATFRISAINSISALSPDAALFRISAVGTVTVSAHEVKQSDAASLLTSAKQGDAALLRTSASLFPDTVGGLTIYKSISVSSAAAVKAAAGAPYGYYAWNNDTKPNYIKLYNLSGGVTIGTDTPLMVIALPASAAANVNYPMGLVGFTAGISIAATSAVADNATSLPNTSSVGIDLFYK